MKIRNFWTVKGVARGDIEPVDVYLNLVAGRSTWHDSVSNATRFSTREQAEAAMKSMNIGDPVEISDPKAIEVRSQETL